MHNTFGVDIIPSNDAHRLKALKRYRLLETPAEKVFDNMTVLASEIFRAPISLISLVDAEMVFFKSTKGVGNVKCADRGESLCALAILSPQVMVFENTLHEPVLTNSPAVHSHGVRFYAGAPLKTHDGFLIGTICVVDFNPRTFTEQDRIVLDNLSKVVMEQMELRLTAITEIEKRAKLIQKKDEFISVASHELKTPVTSLMASLQLLDRMKNDPNPQVISKLIAQSNKSLNKLNILINDLLNVSRISEGQLELRKTTFNIAQLIDNCCEYIRTAGTHTIILEGDRNLEIHADEQKIDQVIVNMVNNAIKYVPDSKEITIIIGREDEYAKVTVKDQGPGIEPEQVNHIFERYYRANENEVKFSGLGLGLYICSEIVKRHGGKIGVETQLGKGSSFWFTLPFS